MRFLLDANHSKRTCQYLRLLGHDAVHCTERLPPSADDTQVLQLARAEQRVIITSDRDFGRLVALSEESGPSIITFNMSTYRPEIVNARLGAALPQIESDLAHGALVMVTDTRVRVRRLPI